MYSLRKEPFEKSLQRLANIGYSGIELYGTGGMIPVDVTKILKKYNMKVVGNHIPLERLIRALDKEFEINNILENKNIVCPTCHYDSIEDINRLAETLTEIAYKCRNNGFVLLLHNHDGEFKKVNDEYVLDYLLKTMPKYFNIELDVFWAKFAGVDPLKYIESQKDRCKIIHLKDLKDYNDKSNINLGEGIVDIGNIIRKDINVEYVYEREDDGFDPWDNINISYQYFNRIANGGKVK